MKWLLSQNLIIAILNKLTKKNQVVISVDFSKSKSYFDFSKK